MKRWIITNGSNLEFTFFLIANSQVSLEDFNFKSKLRASPFVFQVLHLHLQTRGILPSLSAKQSFLNMIQTRSQISKLGAFSLVCQWVRISSLKHVSIITPNNIDLQSHPSFSKISLLFHILLVRENSQSLHLFNCLRRIQPYKL